MLVINLTCTWIFVLKQGMYYCIVCLIDTCIIIIIIVNIIIIIIAVEFVYTDMLQCVLCKVGKVEWSCYLNRADALIWTDRCDVFLCVCLWQVVRGLLSVMYLFFCTVKNINMKKNLLMESRCVRVLFDLFKNNFIQTTFPRLLTNIGKWFFDVLLTVHLSIILVINQLDAQNFCFIISLLYASTCFEQCCVHHQEVKIVLYSI